MFNLPSYKSNQFLWLVFKLLILIICGYFIYNTLTSNEDLKLDVFHSILIDSNIFSLPIIAILLILTFLNWILEIKKWKLLANKVRPISWKEATQQSLASLTFSLITPNRIGEYGAKALYYQKENRKNILLLNFIGNFYQLMATVIVGSLSSVYLMNLLSDFNIPILFMILFFIVICMFLAIIMARFLFENFDWAKRWREKLTSGMNLTSEFKNHNIFIISLGRYLIFTHQFYFLLLIFGTFELSYSDYLYAFTSISCVYLFASFVPMLSLFDFVIKGSIAVYVFSIFGISPLETLTITTLMWIFNFVLPAIIGSYFVLTFKPIKS